MADIREIIEGTDVRGVARALAEHLSKPLRSIEAGELQSPEEDVVDYFRDRGMTEDQRERLSSAVTHLLNVANYEIVTGSASPKLPELVGRVGFLCTSLDLRADWRLYCSVARNIRMMQAAGSLVSDADLFLVLRAVGQLAPTRHMLIEAYTLWLDLLRHNHRGVRTLAAQNLVRMGSSPQAASFFGALVLEDFNVAFVAREWLKLAGSAEQLAKDAGFLDFSTFEALVRGLEDVGEVKAVATLRAAQAAGGGGDTPVLGAPPLWPPLPSPLPRTPSVERMTARATPSGTFEVIHLSSGIEASRAEVAAVQMFFRKVTRMPDVIFVQRLVVQDQVGRLHLTGY